MTSDELRAERAQVAAHLARHGLDAGDEPPPTVRRLVLNLGPAIGMMMEVVQWEPTALRWLAATLGYWSERTAEHADAAERQYARAASAGVEALAEHLAAEAPPPP